MPPLGDQDNITLIGMPGVGKSTVGVLLAKATARQFLDTDVLLQARQGRRLQEILDRDGAEAFRHLEAQCLLSLHCRRHVIATGGSAVYSEPAMAHLAGAGPIVRLELPIDALVRRIDNLDVRGVVMARGQSLEDLYRLREPLYRRWADLTIDCTGKTQDQVVAAILAELHQTS